MQVGAESTKQHCKNTAKHNCLCKDMAKFLLCFPRLLYEYSVRKQHMHIYCIVFSEVGTIRKSVRAVDEKQDISLLWPNILYVELVEMPSKIL